MSIRQEKIARVIQKELGEYFQRESRSVCMGAMVSVTVVRLSPDLSIAKVYLSFFGKEDIQEVFDNIQTQAVHIRYEIAKIVRHQLRKTPEFHFYIDDSFEYAQNINKLLED